MHRITLTPTYILHTRPFQNTSLIVELFSKAHGRIAVVAKSARGPKSRYKGHLQLFTPMLASWSGRHELKTLGQIELHGMPIQLNQTPLFCGFYLNELLVRLLQKEDPHPALFDVYHQTVCDLENSNSLSVTLRRFEKKLLEELGYGLPLKMEAKTRRPIVSEHFYRYEAENGFIQCDVKDEKNIFSGKHLIAIAKEEFETESVLHSAKCLMRMALQSLLGQRMLYSRCFFEG